jgi:hypothetical protein
MPANGQRDGWAVLKIPWSMCWMTTAGQPAYFLVFSLDTQ